MDHRGGVVERAARGLRSLNVPLPRRHAPPSPSVSGSSRSEDRTCASEAAALAAAASSAATVVGTVAAPGWGYTFLQLYNLEAALPLGFGRGGRLGGRLLFLSRFHGDLLRTE